jgi:oligosaccharide repeat unit polymerase
MYILIITCLLLMFFSYRLSNKDIFSPAFITPSIWLVCLSLFLVLPHTLPSLTTQFLSALAIWMICFVFFSLTAQSIHYPTLFKEEPSQQIRSLYVIICILTFPLLLAFAYKAIHTGPSSYWATNLRLAATGKTSSFTDVYTPFYSVIWIVAYIIELTYYSRKNRFRVIILGALFVSFGVFTMAKAALMQFFIITITILHLKGKIKTRHIIIGLCVLFYLFITLQSIRQGVNTKTSKSGNFLELYILSDMSAFDTLKPMSAEHFGENVFRFIYAISYHFHIISTPPIDVLLPFIKKPIETNTYTAMYPFFKDFGYIGLFVFSSLLGFFYGMVFKKAQQKDAVAIILYAYFIYMIFMQYAADMFFTSLAGTIKTSIITLLPFLWYRDKYRAE